MCINLIWDMDGTLIDSYNSIVDATDKTLKHFGLSYEKDYIREMVIKESVGYLIRLISKEKGLNFDEMWKYYTGFEIDLSIITLMPNAKEVLEELTSQGYKNYVFTHRGPTCQKLLEMLGIKDYIIEAVDATYGLERKPSSEGIDYLVNKYQLDKNKTYYVGDRLVDQECAKNANVGRIYYQSYKGITLDSKDYDYYIDSLLDILKLKYE